MGEQVDIFDKIEDVKKKGLLKITFNRYTKLGYDFSDQ